MPLFGMNAEQFSDTDNDDVFECGRPPLAIDIITKLKGVTFSEAIASAIKFKINDTLCPSSKNKYTERIFRPLSTVL